MTEITKVELENRYRESTIVYYDTDTVMIKLIGATYLEECILLVEKLWRNQKVTH